MMKKSLLLMGLSATSVLAFGGASLRAELPSRLGGRDLDMALADLARKINPLTAEQVGNEGSRLEASGVTSLARKCAKLPTTQTIFSNVKNALGKHKLRPVYESVVPSKIVIYTDANVDEYEAVFYYYTADVSACFNKKCDLSVTAVKVVAPISDDDSEKILLSEAKWWNDHVSGDLVEAASPQELCKAG
jgi:hypothetical protein